MKQIYPKLSLVKGDQKDENFTTVKNDPWAKITVLILVRLKNLKHPQICLTKSIKFQWVDGIHTLNLSHWLCVSLKIHQFFSLFLKFLMWSKKKYSLFLKSRGTRRAQNSYDCFGDLSSTTHVYATTKTYVSPKFVFVNTEPKVLTGLGRERAVFINTAANPVKVKSLKLVDDSMNPWERSGKQKGQHQLAERLR